jgi:adenylate cyclase
VLYQNALYTAIRPTRKAALSAAVAKALLEFYGDRSETLAAELALLLEAARDFRQAVDYFEMAARNAVHLFANREAVAFLRSALRLLNNLPPGPARDSREFTLQAALGPPLVVTRGYASPETAESYTRAWDLCRGLGKTTAHFDVLFGMWNYHEVSGRLRVADELANELLALAEEGGDASRLLLAHRAVANVALWTGDPRQAKVHFEKALAFYLPEFHREATRTGVAPGMGCMGMLGWTEWLLGNSAEALLCVEKQLVMAREISQPFTTAISLVDASFLHQFLEDHTAVKETSEALMRLAEAEDFALWQAGSLVMHGWAIFHLGQRAAGLAEMRKGIERWHATGAEVASTYYLALLAASQGLAGDTVGGLATVDAALVRAGETGENYWKPELLLVKGDLLAAAQPEEAQAARLAAFQLARSTGAKAFERRAATRLGNDLPDILLTAPGA